MFLYVLHLEDSQDDMLVTSRQFCNIPSQFIQTRVQKRRYKKYEVPNVMHWCGARKLVLFLTLKHYKNMLASGRKGGGDK